jgi:hypothetical protein
MGRGNVVRSDEGGKRGYRGDTWQKVIRGGGMRVDVIDTGRLTWMERDTW